MGMDVMSKNMASRRLSLYLISPLLAVAIWLAVTVFTVGSAGLGACFSGPRGVREAGSSLIGSVVSSWNSQILMSCGLPSSLMVKSLVLRLGTGLPSLSLAKTSTTTNCVVDEKL